MHATSNRGNSIEIHIRALLGLLMLCTFYLRGQAQAQPSNSVETDLALRLRAEQGEKQAKAMAAELRLRAYAADMKAAHVAIEQNSRGQAARLLARYRAKPGEEDLRGVEWRYLWQHLRGDEVSTWQRQGMVNWVQCTPDGLTVFSGERDQKVKVLNSQTGRVIRELDITNHYYGPIAVGRDGKHIASWDDGVLSVHTTLDGQLVARTTVQGVQQVNVLQDGQFVAAAVQASVLIFRVGSTGGMTQELSIPVTKDTTVSFTPDGKQLLLGGDGEPRTPREFAIPGGQELHVGASPLNISGQLAVDPTGRYLLSIKHNQMSLYLLETRQCLWANTNLHKSEVRKVVFSKDGEQMATASFDQTTALIRTRDGALLGRLRGHQNEVWTIDGSPDGQFLFTGSKDGTIKKWRWTAPKENRHVLSEHEVLVPKVRQGDPLLTFDTASRRLSKWSGLERTSWPISSNLPTPATYSGLVQNGYHIGEMGELVILGTNNVLTVSDLSAGTISRKVVFGSGDIWGTVISENRQTLALIRGSTNTSVVPVELWDLGAGRLIRKLPLLDCTEWYPPSRLMTFSRDGQFLAYPDGHYDVVVWNLKEDKEVGRFHGATWFLRHVSFSGDGKHLAGAGAEGVIYIWNVATGRLATPPLEGHGSGILTVFFSRDGRTLISAGDDNSVRFWSTANGGCAPSTHDVMVQSKTYAAFQLYPGPIEHNTAHCHSN
jgi:WD40 repeat protein